MTLPHTDLGHLCTNNNKAQKYQVATARLQTGNHSGIWIVLEKNASGNIGEKWMKLVKITHFQTTSNKVASDYSHTKATFVRRTNGKRIGKSSAPISSGLHPWGHKFCEGFKKILFPSLICSSESIKMPSKCPSVSQKQSLCCYCERNILFKSINAHMTIWETIWRNMNGSRRVRKVRERNSKDVNI